YFSNENIDVIDAQDNSKNEEQAQSSIVYLNDKFNEEIPMFYIDSGIVISFAFVKLLEDQGLSNRKIKQALINGNPHNIDYKTADVLLDLYEKNRNGEIAFCVPPAVYKETMIDNLKHDDIYRQYTRKFVTENCFLAFPNENIKFFAKKTVALQNALKGIKSRDGIFGLNPDMKRRKVGDSEKRVWVDDNFEDRMILSQIAIITKQGKQNVTYISCSKDVENSKQMVQGLYDEEKGLDDKNKSTRLEKVKSRNPERVIFIQINSNDFGTKVFIDSSNSTERRGKREVARQLEQYFNGFFNGKGGLEVKTPLEL
ncbi:MAG: hypothetical protein IJX17_00805, partial [Clostridia bacterium]|nr:hypothetical protein [Clostridia bacterium]